ncbi:MAG: hypothetical protein WA893_12320 [Xanthobacteraceae bacterium]
MTKPIRIVLMGALAVGLTLPLCSAARADHDYSEACHQRLQNAKAKIDRDAAKYGEHSGQVDRDVAKLDNERAWCRDHKADWDHNLFDVGIYIRK